MAGDCKACCLHVVAEEPDICLQLVHQGGVFGQHLENFYGCTSHTRCQRVGEEVRTGLVTKQVNQDLWPCGVSTCCTAKCLSQCTVDDIHLVHDSAQLWRAPSSFAKKPCGMALVDKDLGVVSCSQVTYLLQGSDVTIHGEHAICDNQSVPRLVHEGNKNLLQVFQVQVLVAMPLCLAQANAIDDGGMVKSIGYDCILWP
mmetsp:Transcript_76034/g.180955  ORF Transcript_76034/g.180955 Transcript_76034/m.180955 type:complete len:200 (-) Transcript_76034:587-1186(-)